MSVLAYLDISLQPLLRQPLQPRLKRGPPWVLIDKGGVYAQRMTNPQHVQITFERVTKKYGMRCNQRRRTRKEKILDRGNCMSS